MRYNFIYRWVIFALVMLNAQATFADKFTLLVEATYAPDRGKEVYETFRKWLEKQIGHEIEIIIDNNYYLYWRQAKGDKTPDFTFDSPHIAAYRAINKQYQPVAVTQEDLVFHLISLEEVPEGSTVEKYLTNKQVAMLPNPSLASLYFKQWFDDLFASPKKNVAALDWQETIDIVYDGEAQAAIVPQWVYNLYPNFISLKQSPSLPGRTFMASPNVPQKIIDKLQNVLLTMHEMTDDGYDSSYELNTAGFKEVNFSRYNSLVDLLTR